MTTATVASTVPHVLVLSASTNDDGDEDDHTHEKNRNKRADQSRPETPHTLRRPTSLLLDVVSLVQVHYVEDESRYVSEPVQKEC